MTAGAITLLGAPVSAHAETSADLQAQADSVRAQLDEWQSTLNTTSDAYYEALAEHDAAVASMNEQQAVIDDCQSQISTLQSHLGTRAADMYRSGQTSYLDVLLGATSFEDFVTSWDFLNEMNQDDADSVEQVKELRQQAEDAKAEYANQEQIASDKLAEAEAAKEQAEETVSAYQAQVASLDSQVAALVAQEQAAAQAAATQADSDAAYAADDSGGGGSSGGGGGSRPVGSYGSVLDAAESRVGCAYEWGAEGPDTFDCSGLVVWAYAQIGISLPHYSGALGFIGDTYPVSQAEPGDILWESGHVGLYCGGGTSVEAMDDAHGVCYGNAWRFDHATHP